MRPPGQRDHMKQINGHVSFPLIISAQEEASCEIIPYNLSVGSCEYITGRHPEVVRRIKGTQRFLLKFGSLHGQMLLRG